MKIYVHISTECVLPVLEKSEYLTHTGEGSDLSACIADVVRQMAANERAEIQNLLEEVYATEA